jgi:hypothetical protein
MQMVVRKKLTFGGICFIPLLHKNFHKRKVNCKALKGNQIIVLTMKGAGRIFKTGESQSVLDRSRETLRPAK